jgi:hypothetical protein
LDNQYETNENTNVRIKNLENVIITIFHRHYKGGLFKELQDYEDAFTELVLFGQATWNDDDIRKRCMMQNAQKIGMIDAVFEALVSDKSFSETCNFLRSHANRHDQQTKEESARQIHDTYQPTSTTKKDKVKTVLALINELQIQDSTSSDEEIDISSSSKTARICKLAQVPPEIWMALFVDAKKWLLNETKRQKQEDELKKSSNIMSKDTIKVSEKDKTMPPICQVNMQKSKIL